MRHRAETPAIDRIASRLPEAGGFVTDTLKSMVLIAEATNTVFLGHQHAL